jgi:ribosomal protein S1
MAFDNESFEEEENFAEMFAASEKKQETSRVVEGEVVEIQADENRALVGVGDKLEGILSLDEISEDGELKFNVGDKIKGFIKKSDLSRERADQKTDRYGVGDKVDATVTNIDKKARKIALSIKAKEIEEEKKVMAEYGSSDSGASLGDILGAALAKKDANSS